MAVANSCVSASAHFRSMASSFKHTYCTVFTVCSRTFYSEAQEPGGSTNAHPSSVRVAMAQGNLNHSAWEQMINAALYPSWSGNFQRHSIRSSGGPVRSVGNASLYWLFLVPYFSFLSSSLLHTGITFQLNRCKHTLEWEMGVAQSLGEVQHRPHYRWEWVLITPDLRNSTFRGLA